MSALKEYYTSTVVEELKKQLGRDNVLDLPRIEKVTINTGLSTKRDAKFVETLQDTLTKISGQKPVVTKARKSEAGFKLREGMPTGVMVTLRGARMWSFIDKLITVTFPRIRDFRGINESCVDSAGNFSVGFKEHTAFIEIDPDAIENLHGLQVTITTTARNREEGLVLFKALGFPFKKTNA